jgi:predicted pyridoxine 5'-phosphate oxidase superfamily flavin-nucleotide-binding protein
MTDKKLFQLVAKTKPQEKMTPEMKAALDEMYQEILTGDVDFIMATGDSNGEDPVGFITNLDTAGSNLMLDQMKLGILMGQID